MLSKHIGSPCLAVWRPRRPARARAPGASAASDAALRAAAAAPHAGKCWLVGAGPGPADLLTLRAARALEAADVVVYDDLGAQGALGLAPAGAERLYVGKRGGRPSIKQPEIDSLLVDKTRQGLRVVRLKGGCPSVFSRAGSELRALAAAGCDHEIVPGVSSALAAPLLAGFPLTDTALSKSFAVTTGHDAAATDWGRLARGADTLVVLMGGDGLPLIAERLQAAGRPGATPVAIIKAAGTPEQRVWRTRLDAAAADTADEELSPCIIVVGDVAAWPAAAAAAAAVGADPGGGGGGSGGGEE
ncbi:MAG: tetrapyrrole methylase [Monoraphidium minutum]|nr:MAG: tetrapyrrole methylase [Monoraphidium minutum]